MNNLIELTQKILSFPSVTVDMEYSSACLDYIQNEAKKYKPAKSVRKTFSCNHPTLGYEVDNLYLEWTFGTGENNLCFMGHVDVVPVGDVNEWTYPPFSAHIEDGYMYARGTTDMKGAVSAFIHSIFTSIDDLQHSNFKIGIILTGDEEYAGINGSDKVLKWMKSEGIHYDHFLVGEPSSKHELGSHVKYGRRGSLCGRLIAKGTAGHIAYPELNDNAIYKLLQAIQVLNEHDFNDGNEAYGPTNFEAFHIEAGDPKITNIAPGIATCGWNVRFTSEWTSEKLDLWAKEKIKEVGLEDHVEVISNINTSSNSYLSKRSFLSEIITESVQNNLGIKPEFDGSGGATDGRFVHTYYPNAEVLEFGLPSRGGIVDVKPDDYGIRGGMHQIDERLAVKDLEALGEVYKRIILKVANKKQKETVLAT